MEGCNLVITLEKGQMLSTLLQSHLSRKNGIDLWSELGSNKFTCVHLEKIIFVRITIPEKNVQCNGEILVIV